MTSICSVILAFMLSIGGGANLSVHLSEKPHPGLKIETRELRPIQTELNQEQQLVLRFFIRNSRLRVRFLQTDPMGYEDSLNLYQAFNQNPVNFVDPLGLQIRRSELVRLILANYTINILSNPENKFYRTDLEGNRVLNVNAIEANLAVRKVELDILDYEELEDEYRALTGKEINKEKTFWQKVKAAFGFLPSQSYNKVYEFDTAHLKNRRELTEAEFDAIGILEDRYVKGCEFVSDIYASLSKAGVEELQYAAIFGVINKAYKSSKGLHQSNISGQANRIMGENLSPKLAKTFKGGKYTSRVLNEPEIFYRYHGVDNRLRPVTFVPKTKYSSKKFMRIRLAIKKKWGVNINQISKMKVPSGVRIFEGQAASQGLPYIGGGHQAIIMHPSKGWILNTIVF
ncbi:MAG: RHS repeat-associated core domain-containing protein [Candidatus Thorarchaeota archaeon]